MKPRLLPITILALLTYSAPQPLAASLGTAFTYQGSLKDGANPAQGTYDLKFTLYDAPIGMAQVGPVLTNSDTMINNGLFTVTLDFGMGAFAGSERWLEIGVRTNDGGAFSMLSPRQALTATPYTLYAPTAGTAASAGSVAAGDISGTLALVQLPGEVVINNSTSAALAGTFSGIFNGSLNGNGAGLTNLGGESLRPGSVPGSALAPGAVTHLDSPGGGPTNVVAVTAAGYVGVHTHAPEATLHVAGGIIAESLRGDGSGLLNLDSMNLTGALSLRPQLQHLPRISTTNLIYGVAAAGNYLYLACGTNGLVVYDVSDISSPVRVGETNNGGFAWSARVRGNHLYLANGADGLRVYSLANPAKPVSVGNAVANDVRFVVLTDNHAYAVVNAVGLRIFNVSQPANPALAGSWNNSAITHVAVEGTWAYAACGYNGLYAIDVANPANLRAYHSGAGGSWVGSVAVADGLAYLACGTNQVRICEVTNPANPFLLGSKYLTSGTVKRVALVERLLCAAAYHCYDHGWPSGWGCETWAGFYDLYKRGTPSSLGTRSLGNTLLDAAGANGIGYLADGTTNLLLVALYGAVAQSFSGQNLSLSGSVTASSVSANYFSGSGAYLTGIPVSSLPANVAYLNSNQTFTASSSFAAGLRLNTTDAYLLGGSDTFHGLGWYGAGKLFAGANINGPVLYGGSGGALGATGNGNTLALQWDGSRNVSVNGNFSVGGNSTVTGNSTVSGSSAVYGNAIFYANTRLWDKTLYLRNGTDTAHGLGWYPSGTFAGSNPDGPVLFGCGGGALGTACGNQVIALAWNNSGNVGIGTTSPSVRLSVNGAANNTTGVWGVYSDGRIKEHIQPMPSGSLDQLLQLQGVVFDYTKPELREGYAGVHRGWIAQEVERVFPEWVTEDQAGTKMVTPVGINALTVEALRELRAEKDAQLRSRDVEISELKARLEKLERLLASKLEIPQ